MGHYSEELTGAVESDIIVNDMFHRGIVMAFDGVGTGKLQYTLDDIETVINGSPVWKDWESGDVSVYTTAVIETAVAFKFVNTSGTNKYYLIGQRTV
jgi:hypothetical protein